MNVSVRPELIRWARVRASLSVDELARKVGTKTNPAPIGEWEPARGAVEIPVEQLEKLARATRAPFAMLFLSEPPADELSLRDLRRPVGGERPKPSLNLIETILETQHRQSWLSEQWEQAGEEPLDFVASATISQDPVALADQIRDRLRIGTSERRLAPKTADAPIWLIGRLEESRVTVVRKGFAGTATRRSLDPAEFKGFALADPFAPFVFVNGKDWPGSQVFTIVHECVHLWLGESALPDGDWFGEPADPAERFCNRVAAEVLLPEGEVRDFWVASETPQENAARIGQEFRVSSLAALFRARNMGLVSEREWSRARSQMQAEFETHQAPTGKEGGGDFYRNAGIYLGKRFIREVLLSTLAGRTLYTEAFDLLGTRKSSVVREFAKRYL